MIGHLLWGACKLAIKYVVVPLAVTASTAFVLGGLAERVRRDKEPHIQSQLQEMP